MVLKFQEKLKIGTVLQHGKPDVSDSYRVTRQKVPLIYKL